MLLPMAGAVVTNPVVKPCTAYLNVRRALNCASVGALGETVPGILAALRYVGNGCAPFSNAVIEFNWTCTGSSSARVPRYRNSKVVSLQSSRCTTKDQLSTLGSFA